jgi:TolA-binding protein
MFHSRKVRVFRPFLLSLAVAVIVGCNANQAAMEPPPKPEPERTQTAPSPDVASLPPASASDVGERLGRLDAQMRTAPLDSVLLLRAEYQRILDSIDMARREPVQTGGPDLRNSADSNRVADGGNVQDSSSLTSDSLHRGTTTQEVQTGGEPLQEKFNTFDTVDQSFVEDPSKRFNGLRPSELRGVPGYSPSKPGSVSEARPKAGTRRHPGRSRMLATRRKQSRTPRYAGQNSASRRGISRSQMARMSERRIVNGIAATQAGRYTDAIKELGPALGSAGNSARSAHARYSYALSLEKTGQLSRAADQYLRLSRNGGAMGQKAYVAYCRLLARLGQRDRAKRLVLQFIQRNPDSTSVVTARRLLQAL